MFNSTAAVMETAAPMQIDVAVRPIEPKGKLIGFATVTFGEAIAIPDFRIFNGENGLFVGNPSKQDSTSRTGYRDTARLIGDDIKEQLNVAVRDAYISEVEKLQARAAAVAVPEKPRIRDQLEKAGREAARHNAETQAQGKGKDKAARDDR
jgi:DNA-binding cell septation regulator SpoVG